MSKKALILTWERYQDHEVIYPYYRVQEGFEVDLMTNVVEVHGYLGTYNESTQLVSDFDDEKKIQIIWKITIYLLFLAE